MKVYTRTGDSGKTALFSGERLAKSDARIDAYGDVDELNAVVGALLAALPSGSGLEAVKAQLVQIQSDLFLAGAWLATAADSLSAERLESFTQGPIQRLEDQIDAMQVGLDALTAFVLPGGHPAAAWAHVARTICRRAERKTVALVRAQGLAEGGENVLPYLNRLSDYCFVLARRCNQMAGVADVVWQGNASMPAAT
jgi:cob(I)alamin adenosyltransferase